MDDPGVKGGISVKKLVMTAKDIGNALGISLPKVYKLTETEGFPLLRVGRKKLIPVDGFKRWVEQSSGGATDDK